jgi:hypothetical protein
MASSVIKIITMGKTHKVGKIVMATILPELESVEFLVGKEEGHKSIPKLLAIPSEVQAVVLGGGVSPEDRDALRADVVGREGFKQVPWLIADPSKVPEALLVATGPPPAEVLESYAKEVGSRLKAWVLQKKEEGAWKGETGGDSEIYLF